MLSVFIALALVVVVVLAAVDLVLVLAARRVRAAVGVRNIALVACVFGVSVLVRNRAGQVIGSLNASANATLVNEDRVRNVFVPELRDCAEKLSDVLL